MLMDFIKKLLGKDVHIEQAAEYDVKPFIKDDREDDFFDPMDIEIEPSKSVPENPINRELNRSVKKIDAEVLRQASALSLEDDSTPSPSLAPAEGIARDMAIVKKGERVVFAVDCDMDDIPNWIEWDLPTNKMVLAFMAGGSLQLPSKIPPDEKDVFQDIDRVMLVARMGGKEVAHFIPLIVRK